MSKKFTYEYVKSYFEEQGCELLEKEYINCSTKMKYRCICGDISSIVFRDFKTGRRCNKCRYSKISKKLSLDYEYVKKFFEDSGCEMLDNEYKNARIHINYRCSCGNISRIIFDSFRSGHRCRKCSSIKNAKKQTFSYEYVYNYFKEQGCELLEKEYINCITRMKYKCKCGNISLSTFNNFQYKKRCIKCSIKKRSGRNHYEWVEDREDHKEKSKFRQKCYKMLKYSLRRIKKYKYDRTHIMLGYYPEDLQKYIKSHSNWKKVKNGQWHLDHIFPIQAFVDYGIKDIKLINCLENLQPLNGKENCSKGDKYDAEKFERWLESKGYEIQYQ